MLRTAVVRGNACLEQGLRAGVRRQWTPQRIQRPVVGIRRYADSKQGTVAGVPTGPIQATATTNPATTAGATTSTTPAGTLPPPGSTTTTSPPPKRPRRRFRNFLFSLVVLSVLGYAGGVYYSLVSDNFHDFFTEYVPFAEDAVAYFEEREFRRRFPSYRDGGAGGKLYPQRTGEQKVTIGKSSGLTARVAPEDEAKAGSDLGAKGRHSSAKEENKVKGQEKGTGGPKEQTPSTQAKVPEAKAAPKQDVSKEAGAGVTKPAGLDKAGAAKDAKTEEKKASTTPDIEPVDRVNVPDATEPVVQDLVAFINRLITVINASSDAAKYKTALAQDEINNLIKTVAGLKERASQDAEKKIQDAHAEFEDAAKELVKRVEREMQDQEMKWRDEYESEREKISASYQQKLSLELDAAKRVADQKTQNSLVEQEIVLQKHFMDNVRAAVEAERQGRLSKLDELSSSVSELNQLTSDWNEVVDATLQTQHMQVALEAVRAKVMESDHPTPFLNELVALKETSKSSPLVSAAISAIPPLAYQRGIPTPAHLIDRFRRVASEVRKASLLPEDAGIASHAASAVLSRFMFKKGSERGLPEGDDVEATLARTEVLLEEGDLDSAAREMNGLRGWAGVLSKDWVGEVRRVLEVRMAVDVIATEARLQSLLVD
ncbi:MICOS complex subunit mic60 [Saxophila tyrrhenica]|uniref:MICOS complex subunit MIC60 n=1 Tax=Saxophila tyrrhenica TaxID=1690608 RepID=A0AAV9PED6_9PEZI|nr:MICOS complex subunit mic60 [Saxophila tyrrhenica]